jgi:hypothetical protein
MTPIESRGSNDADRITRIYIYLHANLANYHPIKISRHRGLGRLTPCAWAPDIRPEESERRLHRFVGAPLPPASPLGRRRARLAGHVCIAAARGGGASQLSKGRADPNRRDPPAGIHVPSSRMKFSGFGGFGDTSKIHVEEEQIRIAATLQQSATFFLRLSVSSHVD